MSTFFVKTLAIAGGAAPSDANDGLDPIGFNLSGATYDDTGNVEGERHLSSAGAFTSYVFTSGDLIFLDAGAGIIPGLFEIAARVDDDAILLVNSAGADSTADVGSSTGPFLTFAFVASTVVAGDTARICADGDHIPAASILFAAANAGTNIANVLYTGATARGVVDGTRPIVDGQNTTNLFSDDNDTGSLDFTTFQHLDLFGNGNTLSNVLIVANQDGLCFVDCVVRSAGLDGIRTQIATGYTCLRCEIHSNVSAGIGTNGTQRGNPRVIDSSIHDNGGRGIRSGSALVFNSLIYGNGSDGIELFISSSDFQFNVAHCVIHGNGGDGLTIDATTGTVFLTIRNNILSANGGFGLNLAGNATRSDVVGPNNYFNNTAGRASIDGAVEVSIAAIETFNSTAGVETDPNFASVVDGSEDFTPASQDPTFSQGEAGNVPGGVSTVRPSYLGAVSPDLAFGGDGAGSDNFLVLADRQDHAPRVEGVDAIAISAVDAATARSMAKSLFSGDGNASWDNATVVQLTPAADFQGWRLRARVSPPGGGVSVDETFTGLAAATMDDLGNGLVALLNTTPSISNSSYDTGTNVLTVADIADNLGDHFIEVDLLPPAADNTGAVTIPGGVLSITDGGIAAAALDAQMAADSFAIPGVAVQFQQR